MKVKKWLLAFAAFAVMAVVCAVGAGAETFGDFEYEITYDDAVAITNYNGSAENVDIPAEIDGMSVKSIDYNAFNGCTNLTDIMIPDSVTDIGEQAFYNCTSLKEVTIPASVISIGEDAFGYYEEYYGDIGEKKKVDGFKINYVKNSWGHRYATKNGFSDEVCLITNELNDGSLEIDGYAGNSPTYIIPGEIDGKKVTKIGGYAFDGCTELTSITIPDSVTDIGTGAFYNCTSLKSVTIPTSVTSIGIETFGYYKGYDADTDSWKSKKVDGFEINYVKNTRGHWYAIKNGFSDGACLIVSERDDGTLKIDGYAGNSTSYIIPAEIDGKKVTAIGDYAFMDCNELTCVTIPDGVISINDYAFYNCTSLETISIPDSVTSIDSFAFSYCTSLKSVTIPASVTSINWQAFYNCISLKEVTIPASVTDIGNQAFGYCVDTVTYNSKKVDGFKINYVKNTQGHLYAAQNGFTDEACIVTNELEDGTIEISKYYGTNETYIIPPEINGKKVTEIGDQAFEYNTALTSVTIPDTVTRIGWLTFRGCTALTSIKIPDSVTKIESFAFMECDSLKNVSIPASVTEIYDYAFGYTRDEDYNYAKVDGFTLEYVENTAGHLYAALNDFTDEGYFVTEELEDGTLSISGYYAKDETYTIPPEINGKKVTQIKQYAFARNEYLKSIVISENVKEIGQHAFSGCTALTDVSIPDSVTEIDTRAFVNCTSLLNVSVPESVTFIGEQAFGYEYDDLGYEGKIKGFNIKCYKDTAGEQYAKDNGFDYEILESETQCAHSNTEIRNTKSANCITDGYTGDTYCKDCGELISSGEVIPATGNHKFGDWTITKAATCTTAGTKTKTCSVCGKTETATIAKTAHKYDNTVVKPTYTAKGYTLHKCSACGASYKDTYTATLTLAKVGGFKVKAKDSTSITLQWNKNSSASGYIIEAYNGKTWSQVTKIAKNSTLTYKVTKLSASKTYQYRIKAYKTEGKATAYSANSATLSVNTNPSNMSGFKAKSKSYNSITLQWNKNTSATGYELQKWDGKKWVTLTKISKNSTITYTVKSLKASTTYKYRIRAYKTIGKTTQYSAYTTTLSVNTNPSNMSGFKAKAKSYNSITLQWNKNTSATGYELQKWDGKKWVTLTKIAKNSTTTYTVKSLKASTTYKYRIRAYKTIGKATQYSAYSATLSVNTNPTNMSGFKAKSKTATSVTLQWNKNTSATGYELQKWNGKKWVTLTKIAKNSTTTYTVKSLKASTTYKYRIRAYKTIGKATQYSAYSATLSVNTNPSNMSGFKAKSKTATSITLQWNKNTSATGYELQKWDGKKWVTLTKISKNSTTTYTVKSLKASTTYKYRIRAYKTIGKATQYSGYSATLSVNTNPSNISGFKAKSKSYNSITLQWNKNTSATGYELQKWNGKKWVTLTKISKNSTTTYTVKNLKAVTTYKYRIRAYKTIGKVTQYSGYSATLSANTIPSNVSRFRLNSKTGKMLNLGWDMSDDAAGYIVQQYKGGKWVQVAKLGKSKYSVRIKDLSPSTTYKFRIRKYAKIGKTTVYGNWSCKSFKTEGKDCVDEVKFTPSGERIPDELWEYVDEVWAEKYYDKPVKKWVATVMGYAFHYAVPVYGGLTYTLHFGFSVEIIGETNNGFFIAKDGCYFEDYSLIDHEPSPSEEIF